MASDKFGMHIPGVHSPQAWWGKTSAWEMRVGTSCGWWELSWSCVCVHCGEG